MDTGTPIDCAGMRKGWGAPPVASRGVGWGTLGGSIHGVKIWVSGWGELEGGKGNTITAPPWGVWGGSNWGGPNWGGPNWGVWGV